MQYIKNIVKQILLESVVPNKVVDAIKRRYEVAIVYDAKDGNPKGKSERYIQPVAYGLSTAGNPVIRAFQPYGDTETRVPHWKMFKLENIENWKPYRRRHFNEPPGQYDAEGKFNETGDEGMSVVYVVADFKRKKMTNDKILRYNQEVNDRKVANDPLYNFKRNIKNSYQAPADVMKNVLAWQKNKPNWNDDEIWGDTNYSSVNDMQRIEDFGDDTKSTSGVIDKSSPDIDSNNDGNTSAQDLNYRQVAKNGPVYKDDNIRLTNDEYLASQKDEDEEDELENNKN